LPSSPSVLLHLFVLLMRPFDMAGSPLRLFNTNFHPSNERKRHTPIIAHNLLKSLKIAHAGADPKIVERPVDLPHSGLVMEVVASIVSSRMRHIACDCLDPL